MVGAGHGNQRLAGLLLPSYPGVLSELVVDLLRNLLWRPFHHCSSLTLYP